MSIPLTASLLTDQNAHLLDGFECGQESWALEATAWLSSGSLNRALARGNAIWLYTVSTGELAGFGSLGETSWKITSAPIAIIPMLAVHTKWQGKGIGRFIVDDLLQRALAGPYEFIGLWVHEQNLSAKKLYESFGFLTVGKVRGRFQMARRLH
jgi:ribosomal protein S18 acetylase RimI-like enzyme